MKKLKFIMIGVTLFFATAMQAQVSLNVKIGAPPMWGPVGYAEARYYYLPDVEAYYDVPSAMFIYNDRGIWVHRAHLPYKYRNYDLYGCYKVVMNYYHGNAPYEHFKDHRQQYARGYRGDVQRTIGERPGRRGSEQKMSRGDNKPGKNDRGHRNGKNSKEERGQDGGKGKHK